MAIHDKSGDNPFEGRVCCFISRGESQQDFLGEMFSRLNLHNELKEEKKVKNNNEVI